MAFNGFDLNTFSQSKFNMIVFICSLDTRYNFDIISKFPKKVCPNKLHMVFNKIIRNYFDKF
jgi:hypothetical protein